jgi:site-specific DNA-cytosine methylase
MAKEKNDSERKVANASEKLIKKQLLELTSNRYFRLRRLTPRECFKLMGVDMCSINKLVTSGVPEAQLYKQAGNAIVVDVLVNLYKSIFNDINVMCYIK